MTVFFNATKANTFNFTAGDVGYVPKTFPHYVGNTGNADLIFLEMFKAPKFENLSLSERVRNIPPALAIGNPGISMETLQRIPKNADTCRTGVGSRRQSPPKPSPSEP